MATNDNYTIDRTNNNNAWLPLLGILLVLLFAWGIYSANTGNSIIDTTENQQQGVGGGPNNNTAVSPTLTVTPTQTTTPTETPTVIMEESGDSLNMGSEGNL